MQNEENKSNSEYISVQTENTSDKKKKTLVVMRNSNRFNSPFLLSSLSHLKQINITVLSFMIHVCFQFKPTMLAVLALASLSHLVWASNLCPPTCQCLHNLTSVVCKGELNQIPELPDSTERLYVSYNKIQEIPQRGLEELQV